MKTNKLAVKVLRPEVELPLHTSVDDIGYDVTLLNREENRAEDVYGDVNNFLTGISLPHNQLYYYEISAKQSLHRMGYMLPSGRIMIKATNGELVIPLYKFKDVEDIELPFAAVQIIPKAYEPTYIIGERVAPKTRRRAHGYNEPDFDNFESPVPTSSSRGRKSSSRSKNHMY